MEWTPEDCTTLALKHPFEADTRIKFHQPSHAYAILCPVRGWITKPDVISVSAIVDSVKPKFDKMGKSMNKAGSLAAQAKKFNRAAPADPTEYESAKLATFGWYASIFKLNATISEWQEAILDLWNRNGKEAADLGTAHHLDIERYWDGLPPLREPTPEWEQFQAWLADHPEIIPIRTELRLGSYEYDLAGTPDFLYTLATDPPNTARILDWKRYKDVYDRGASAEQKAERAQGPLAHLDIPWTTIFGCRIQTWSYAKLEYETCGLPILSCDVLSCHPNQSKYELVPLERIPDDILDLCFAERAALSQRRRADFVRRHAPMEVERPKISKEEMRSKMREMLRR